MKRQLLVALASVFTLILFGSTPAQAGLTYSVGFGPPPGNGGTYGSINYRSSSDFSGLIMTTSPYGIRGIGTPLNSGAILSEQGVSINVVGSSGTFDIGFSNDFVGTIVSSDFTSLGGTAVVDGFFDASAASFFGVDPSTELTGILTLELGQGRPGGAGNDIGLGTFVFGPNTAAPEPASWVLVGLGLAGLAARRAVRGKGRGRAYSVS
jgi:hypothetical protein